MEKCNYIYFLTWDGISGSKISDLRQTLFQVKTKIYYLEDGWINSQLSKQYISNKGYNY